MGRSKLREFLQSAGDRGRFTANVALSYELPEKFWRRFAALPAEVFRAFSKSGLPAGAFLVLSAHYLFLNIGKKKAWPGVDAIVGLTGLSHRQVERHRRALDAAGFGKLQRRRDRNTGRDTSSFFFPTYIVAPREGGVGVTLQGDVDDTGEGGVGVTRRDFRKKIEL